MFQAHSISPALRAMNAYAKALAEDYGDRLDDTARGYLELIQRSSVRMEKHTHDELNYKFTITDPALVEVGKYDDKNLECVCSA